ncbi:MAG: DUF448 domain-containing protein [Pseudomonadota bacterium]
MNERPDSPEDMDLVIVEPTERRRRCVVDRDSHDASRMLRFVVDPDDRLVFDADGRLPGRGLWLSADGEVVKKALARNLFAKAARRRVRVDHDLPAVLEAQLRGRCLQWLGLARRAGQVEIGFEQVERAAQGGDLALLLVAGDAGGDGARKLERFGLPTLRDFSSREIGGALGRPSLVYVGLRPGRLADRLQMEAWKLAGLRGQAAATRSEDPGAPAFGIGEQGTDTGRHPRG